MKKAPLSLLFCALLLTGPLWTLPARAQEVEASYTSLKLPLSAHTAALGGENITVCEDTPWAGSGNPALLSGVSDRSLGLNFMTYASGAVWMGASFVKAFGERHTASVMAQYMGYGSMDETDQTGTVLGSFSPRDVQLGASYSYVLSERWSGGVQLRWLHAGYADLSAMALAADLGLNYLDEERDLSLSAVLRSVGAELKSFDERTARVPFSLQAGMTKGLGHAPVRLSLTLVDLTRWKRTDYFVTQDEKLSFTRKALSHVVVGVDVLPTDYLYLSAGYNFRRGYELKAAGKSHLAGLTLGAGLQLSRFKLGASWARYHQASSSLMFCVGYSL